MLGPPKLRRLDEPIAISLEALVPPYHVSRHLEATLDLDFARGWARELCADRREGQRSSSHVRKMPRHDMLDTYLRAAMAAPGTAKSPCILRALAMRPLTLSTGGRHGAQ